MSRGGESSQALRKVAERESPATAEAPQEDAAPDSSAERGQTVAATVAARSLSPAATSRVVVRCVELVTPARQGTCWLFSGWRKPTNGAMTPRPTTSSRRHRRPNPLNPDFV